MRDGNRVAGVIPACEAAGTDELDRAERCADGVLAPALDAAQHSAAVDESAAFVDGVPPEHEAGLLVGVAPGAAGLVAVGLTEVVGRPTEDLPAERALGEQPFTGLISLPRRAERDRLERRFGGLTSSCH